MKGTDKGEGWKGLGKHIGQGDVDRAHTLFLGEEAGAALALEVVCGIPATNEGFVGALFRMGLIGKESARLARPGKQGAPVCGEPTAALGIASALTQPSQTGSTICARLNWLFTKENPGRPLARAY